MSESAEKEIKKNEIQRADCERIIDIRKILLLTFVIYNKINPYSFQRAHRR